MGQDTVHIEPTLCTVATELHLFFGIGNRHVVGQAKVYTQCGL